MPRRGFTLRELLAVSVILALVMAILFPAIQASRARARREACSRNLKFLGVALRNYHDTHRCLPPASTGPPNVPGAGRTITTAGDRHGHVYSWQTLIIPFMDNGLFGQFNFLRSTFSPQPVSIVGGVPVYNHETAAAQFPAFQCPAYCGDFLSAAPEYGPNGVDFPGIALTNYVGIAGVDRAHMFRDADAFDGRPSDEARLTGIFPYQRPVATASPPVTRFRDIHDGTSNTLMMVETREPRYAAWWDGSTAGVVTFQRLKYQSTVPGSVAIEPAASLVALNRGGGEPDPNKPGKRLWYLAAEDAAATYGEAFRDDWSWGPSSDHPGGANHLMGDASVQFITDDVDPAV